MTQHQPRPSSIYMLLAIALGYVVGRSCFQQEPTASGMPDRDAILGKLDDQRRVLYDAHKILSHVSKGMEKAAAQPH